MSKLVYMYGFSMLYLFTTFSMYFEEVEEEERKLYLNNLLHIHQHTFLNT